jgi:hypothetical protein
MSNELNTHIRAQVRNNFFINLALNGAFAWLLLRGKPAFGAWGENGYAADMIVTGFLIAALLTVIVAKIHRSQLARGQHEAVPEQALGSIARAAPRNDWLSALMFGTAGALLAAVTVGVLDLLPLAPFEAAGYALFKGLWAGVLAAFLVPPAIRIGLRAGA